jgi:hypothetical protein
MLALALGGAGCVLLGDCVVLGQGEGGALGCALLLMEALALCEALGRGLLEAELQALARREGSEEGEATEAEPVGLARGESERLGEPDWLRECGGEALPEGEAVGSAGEALGGCEMPTVLVRVAVAEWLGETAGECEGRGGEREAHADAEALGAGESEGLALPLSGGVAERVMEGT